MRRMLMLTGAVLLVLAFAVPPASHAYPIWNCGNFCPVVPYGQCMNECTGTVTTCQEWWWNCVSYSPASQSTEQCAQGLTFQTVTAEPETVKPTA